MLGGTRRRRRKFYPSFPSRSTTQHSTLPPHRHSFVFGYSSSFINLFPLELQTQRARHQQVQQQLPTSTYVKSLFFDRIESAAAASASCAIAMAPPTTSISTQTSVLKPLLRPRHPDTYLHQKDRAMALQSRPSTKHPPLSLKHYLALLLRPPLQDACIRE